MSSSIRRQVTALVNRYGIVVLNTPIRSLIRCISWPGLLLGLCYWVLSNFQETDDDFRKKAKKTFASMVGNILLFSTAFHIYSFSEWMVKDRATRFKSLMISMGLKRVSYHIANAICMFICLLPITMTTAILTRIYIFDDSEASIITMVLLFFLFTLHLIGLTFALVSFITSTSYVAIIFIALVLEPSLQVPLKIWVKTSSEGWRPFILFFSSLSPYQSVRMFSESYVVNKNNGPTDFQDDLVAQPTYLILVGITFWTILAFVWARWFEEVCPWQTDSAVRNPWFCFENKAHYDELVANGEELSERSSKYFEGDANRREVGIQVHHVCKSFRGVPAVDDLSFDIHRGETTLLLGHNGAGKTTLMNMILGLLTPDMGKVAIKDRSEKRPAVGVCPQTSVLDDDLSVKQHIALFIGLKSNLSGLERSEHLRQTIDDVSLGPHSHKRPYELSGGMKRKLSLGMAFAGKSGVLILDEPSSGLDPDSRVFVWDAIRRYRTDRTVLLSTQHMEEADYLGDRIAIMSEGRVVCCGSSVFLNKLFGSGYKLRIECQSSKKQSILDHIRKHFSDSKEVESGQTDSEESPSNRNVDLSLVVELKDHDKSKDTEHQMIKLLEDIEANTEKLGIKLFGLKSSSIEDVMLETTKHFSVEPKEATRLTMISTNGHLTNLSDNQKIHGASNHIMQALIMKHIRTYITNWRSTIFFRLLVPAIAAWQAADGLNPTFLGVLDQNYTSVLTHVFMVFHFIYYPVLERSSKFKTIQLASSANYVSYWLAQGLIDFITVITNTILLNVFFSIAFHGRVTVSIWTIHAILTGACILYGLSAQSFSYVLSTIFGDPKTAIGYNILIYNFGMLASLIITIMTLAMPSMNLTWLKTLATYFFVTFSPTDGFQYILFGLTNQGYIKPLNNAPEPKSLSPVLYGFGTLVFQILLYVGVLCLVELQNFDLEWYMRPSNLFSYCCCFRKTKTSSPTTMVDTKSLIPTDDDVIDETAKAMSVIKNVPANTLSLVVANLSKSYYRNVPVVEGLSFTVQKGECFGLLGVNGAGKSTTFSMLIAESPPDSGKVWANDHYSHEGVTRYRQRIGYDPQQNPELFLSPYEALYLMARLRKVPEFRIPLLINSVLELLEMGQHTHKLASDLSGGTKRKLALGMALIGNPDLLALDEPTAGVDPLARRSIWRLLKTLRSQNSVSMIISSHAMEECEAICDRISVMARGRLRCIGTFLHLRSKFSQGCTLKVQFVSSPASPLTLSGSDSAGAGGQVSHDNNKKDIHENGGRRRSSTPSNSTQAQPSETVVLDLKQRLEGSIGSNSVKLTDRNVNSATFSIVDNRVRRSILFKIMREFRQRHPNVSYMVNDSSLEDIFISIAREQQQLESSKRS